MRVLVTGGTGYVGSAVVRALVAAGHKVTGLSRSTEAAKKLAALDAHARPGSIDQPASIERAADGHDALVHIAASYSPEWPSVDRAAIFAMVDAAKRAKQPRMVVYTSGVWVLGNGGGDEDTVCDHPAAASAHRPALERDLLAAADDTVTTAVIRPGMVYGGAGGVAGFLCDLVARAAGRPGVPIYVGDGENRWPLVHLDDNAQLYRRVLEERAGGVFHAVEDEPLRAAEIARLLHQAGAPAPASLGLEHARQKLGPLGESISLDIPATAKRAKTLGWSPAHRFSDEVSRTWNEFKGA